MADDKTLDLGMGYEGLQDPLQGYDIKVSTVSGADGTGAGPLVGAFTSLMFKIVNQTETYMPLNSRIPRMLDGEVIVVWSLEQGLVEMDIVTNTFGASFATGFAGGRPTKISRSRRFNIKFASNAMIDASAGTFKDDTFSVGSAAGTAATGLINPADAVVDSKIGYQICLCRVDTFSFGVAAGRHVVANAWQGTGEYLKSLEAPKK